jgi:hypothetical protein
MPCGTGESFGGGGGGGGGGTAHVTAAGTRSAGIIGEGELMDGPFGWRRVTYADYTASGTGLQTSRLREDARRMIRDAVGGTDDDLVIFCGSGATAAVSKLIGVLELRIPAGLD